VFVSLVAFEDAVQEGERGGKRLEGWKGREGKGKEKTNQGRSQPHLGVPLCGKGGVGVGEKSGR